MSENKPKSTSKTNTKSTNAEVEQRVSEVQQWLLEGYTRAYILKYAAKWGKSDSMVDQYISKATANIKEVNMWTLQDNLAMICSGLWEVFRKAKIDNNLSEQRQVLMSIAKLKGLEQHTVNHVIEDKRDLQDMTDDQLDAILDNPNVQH